MLAGGRTEKFETTYFRNYSIRKFGGGMGQQIIGGDGAPNYWREWGKIIGGDVYPPSPPGFAALIT